MPACVMQPQARYALSISFIIILFVCLSNVYATHLQTGCSTCEWRKGTHCIVTGQPEDLAVNNTWHIKGAKFARTHNGLKMA